jgi:hypothetical protein
MAVLTVKNAKEVQRLNSLTSIYRCVILCAGIASGCNGGLVVPKNFLRLKNNCNTRRIVVKRQRMPSQKS